MGRKENQLYAIKIYFPGQSKAEAYRREYEFLKKLNFKNLINMVDGKEDGKVKMANKPLERRPVLVLEYAEGGELFEHLRQEGRFKP